MLTLSEPDAPEKCFVVVELALEDRPRERRQSVGFGDAFVEFGERLRDAGDRAEGRVG